MILSIAGEAGLILRDFRPDTVVEGSRMQAAQLVIANVAMPCIIRKVVYGNVKDLNNAESVINTSMSVFSRIRHTAHTKKGFVDIQITTKSVQFYFYIHADYVQHLFGTFAMAVARGGLKL